MFYGFLVRPDHRDCLRFLWHKDNDFTKEVQEYRMRVHVFCNSPSPAVAIYCLRRTIGEGETKFGTDTRHFVERHFYVDDGLISLPTESEITKLLKRTSTYTELCVFCDASSWAIAAVAYLKTVIADGQWEVGFVIEKSKLSPQPEPTIPCLELCGAVLAVEMSELILEELDHKPNAVKFYCDSRVVLGYISNDSKRFYVYVHNRVHRIRQSTSPEQWHYVISEQNPADLATRSVPASQLMDTMCTLRFCMSGWTSSAHGQWSLDAHEVAQHKVRGGQYFLHV